MYAPHGPVWCWNVLGADAQYFSQPTVFWYGSVLLPFPRSLACVARCSHVFWMSEPDDSAITPPIQCGQVAGVAPDGTNPATTSFLPVGT